MIAQIEAITNSLFPYQRHGVGDIVALWEAGQDALLADHPGAGKTPQAIVAANLWTASTILIVCPASLRENWRREFRLWSWTKRSVDVIYSSKEQIPPVQVLIVSYDLAWRIAETDLTWQLLILDEAHFLKNRSSRRTKACLGTLWPRCQRRLAITGTPVPNGRAAEAWPLFSRLAPDLFGDSAQFINRYCVRQDTPWGPKYPWSKNLDELGQIASKNFMIRRTKKETHGQLPPFIRSTIPLSIRCDEAGMEFAEEANAVIDSGRAASAELSTARRKLGLLKVKSASEFVAELDAEHIVVFVHHREVMTRMREELDSRNISFVSIDGSTPPALRQQAVDDFQAGKVRVFLASLLAANTGLTLTRASVAVIIEPDWVPSSNEQAECRVYRVSQTEITRVFYLMVPDSLDEAVTNALLRKQRDIAKVMRDQIGENDNDDQIEESYEQNTGYSEGEAFVSASVGAEFEGGFPIE